MTTICFGGLLQSKIISHNMPCFMQIKLLCYNPINTAKQLISLIQELFQCRFAHPAFPDFLNGFSVQTAQSLFSMFTIQELFQYRFAHPAFKVSEFHNRFSVQTAQSPFSMFTKTHEGIFARHNENWGTDLTFASLLMPDIFAKQN